MKTVILCGGLGTRMREETEYKPKCMVEVGNKPIIKHIMEGYMRNSYRHFIMALGYKGDMIKRYFFEYPMMQHPYTISNIGAMKYHGDPMDEKDSFKVTMVDTGMESQTGERLLRLRDYITEPTFLCTYGDGLSNVDIQEVVDFHRTHGRMATLVAVQPRSKYGVLDINDRTYTDAQGYILAADTVLSFKEKPQTDEWVNAGFFVFNRGILDRLSKGPLEDTLKDMAEMGDIMAYRHKGFFASCDTSKDLAELNQLWKEGNAPWIH